jgi:cytochrome c peroxidase
MTRKCRLIVCAALAIVSTAVAIAPARGGQPVVEFSDQEVHKIVKHSPLPLPTDPTNRFLNNEAAARLGQLLFFDERLSSNGKIACATCHDPTKGFSDGRNLAVGLQKGRRHSPTVWNAAYNRWFFWDGRADSLWAQALRPIENTLEMGSTRQAVARLIESDDNLRREYVSCFGELPRESSNVDRMFANVGKALAAYESRLVSRRSPFDVFVEGLASKDEKKLSALSPAGKRGLRLFLGRANCRTCHMGPNFTDGEFHDTRVPPLDADAAPEAGRFAGVDEVRRDPFNVAGEFSDDRGKRTRAKIEFLANSQENWGRFKTPTLRNTAQTAPYMHQGQFASLREVIEYYSTLDRALPAGHHAETILRPLFLNEEEAADLVAFLESLTDECIDPRLLRRPDASKR